MVEKTEIVQEWQAAAGNLLVTLGGSYGSIVLDSLMGQFEAGKLPHYFVIKTLVSRITKTHVAFAQEVRKFQWAVFVFL